MRKSIFIILSSIYLIGCSHVSSTYQIVEKGTYSRLQYITQNNTMIPEFITGYYCIMRDMDTGDENKVYLSEDEYNSYVLGDMIDKDH